MILTPNRTRLVMAARYGMSGMPCRNSARALTGSAFGNSGMKPNDFSSSWRSEASGTTIRSSDHTESKARSSASRARSTISLTVILSRRFGRYSASFIVRSPLLVAFHTGSPRWLIAGANHFCNPIWRWVAQVCCRVHLCALLDDCQVMAAAFSARTCITTAGTNRRVHPMHQPPGAQGAPGGWSPLLWNSPATPI